MATIEVRDLARAYGPVQAVDGISFSVGDGEIFALLGPNGAGKTTTVEILEGYRTRDTGAVSVLGMDPATGGSAYRARIGVVLQSAGFEEEFTVRELVRLQTRLYPRGHDPDELITLVGLAGKSRSRVKHLSGGQRRRLDLALGLAGAPELLFLDEPTTGFDPAARHHAWQLITGLRELGTTILLTTHYLEEAQRLADRVAVMRDGRLIAVGAPEQLRAGSDLPTVIGFDLPPGVPVADLPLLSAAPSVTHRRIRVESRDPQSDTWRLTGWARDHGLDLPDLMVAPPTLEEVYLALTEEAAR
ncbi:ABC-2 type transport system ATP-binding protein [Actinoplanes campanulatus]|uniref:ABC-2 type transport system ATP-binding protein n=1 Tax=Actinoplanes campanulatus TaxID=113559 RepID=A0A7W5AS85_9ACTN|nr:ABC transporter ATP-binding protein [Actinoplanes campanulatus]MBB3101477.1 ABC-2 type transport system ATP-binding protein [Actinoplanes campanulatus]GGN50646.1 multidrug ABC transporter ATP-binding protein [Actinoplanes campanulatus]GID42073.1 multidrug ABC transporter ATP-binding protein [Actinoplanes campanulatus]